jgi:hypothetical protein
MTIEVSTGFCKGKGQILLCSETSAEGAQLRELVKVLKNEKVPHFTSDRCIHIHINTEEQ